MSERIVRFTRDVNLQEQCAGHWSITDGSQVQPLVMLANYEAPLESEGWCYFCSKHRKVFSVVEDCPGAEGLRAMVGDEMLVDEKQAEWLVQHQMAVYPTHAPVADEAVQATLDRTNALMEQMGLPQLDAESLRTIGIVGKKGGRHYQKPADRRLAGDLGVDPDDIAAMRRLSSGS